MWKPKNCSQNLKQIDSKLNRIVELNFKKLVSYTNSQGEKNITYDTGSLVEAKYCYIKDRSSASQETSITNGRVDPSSSKELIFKYFDITNLQINEIKWEGIFMTILGINKLSSVTIDGQKYYAQNGFPFISIIVGINKL